MEPPDVWDGIYSDRVSDTRWKRRFVWIPLKCNVSNTWVWLKYAYEGTGRLDNIDGPNFASTWITEEEYAIKKLKGEL